MFSLCMIIMQFLVQALVCVYGGGGGGGVAGLGKGSEQYVSLKFQLILWEKMSPNIGPVLF